MAFGIECSVINFKSINLAISIALLINFLPTFDIFLYLFTQIYPIISDKSCISNISIPIISLSNKQSKLNGYLLNDCIIDVIFKVPLQICSFLG